MGYQVGDIARLSIVFTDANSIPGDPSFVVLQITDPAASITNVGTVRDSVGAYHFDLVLSLVGTYSYRWSGSGAIQATRAGHILAATTEADPNDLCTLADVKAWLTIPTGTVAEDFILTRLITAASAMFLRICGRQTLNASEYTERRNGNGMNRIMTWQRPIISVQSVGVSGNPVPQSPDGISAGWLFDAGSIYLIGGGVLGVGMWIGPAPPYFQRGIQNVTITYTAGYTTVPPDVAQAVIELVGQKYKRRRHIDEDTNSLQGDVTIAFSRDDIPKEVRMLAETFKIRMLQD